MTPWGFGREVSYETSISTRGGASVDPMPGPWGQNLESTAYLTTWWHQQFTTPASCLTHDRDESLHEGRILVPTESEYRIVLDFEDRENPWAPWQFREMEKYRAELRSKYPNITISARLGQVRSLIGDSGKAAADRVDDLRKFVAPFDEVSPVVKIERGDADVKGSVVRSSEIRKLPQFITMSMWSEVIAGGKPLSPSVSWLVEGSGYRTVTKSQFWRVLVTSAMSSPTTVSVVLRGDVSGADEQRIFDASVRDVVVG